jgi:hypothetical protein
MTVAVSETAVAMETNKWYECSSKSFCDAKRNKSWGVLMLNKLKQKTNFPELEPVTFGSQNTEYMPKYMFSTHWYIKELVDWMNGGMDALVVNSTVQFSAWHGTLSNVVM